MTAAAAKNAKQDPSADGDLDIFISYSRRNSTFAYRLEELLADRDLNVWLDKDDIPPSAEWRQEIEDGIQRAAAVVVVVTPDLAESVECSKEIARAEEMGKRIVPILHIDVEPPLQVQEAVSKRNYIFWRSDADAEAALQGIDESLTGDPEWTKHHTRINRRAILWEQKGEDKSVLERKTQLAEDERMIALDRPPEQPQVTELMRRFIHESRVAERKRSRRNLLISVLVTAVTSVIATIAVLQFFEATRQRQSTQSRALASQATFSISDERDLAALQALESIRIANTTDARASVLRVLATPDRFQRRIDVHNAPITATAISDDGTLAATGDERGTVWVWALDPEDELDPAEPRTELQLEEGVAVANLSWIPDPDGSFLLGFSDSGIATVWSLESADFIEFGTEIPLLRTALWESGEAGYLAGWDGSSMLLFDLDDEDFVFGEENIVAETPVVPDVEVTDVSVSVDGTFVAWAQEASLFVWEWGAGADAIASEEFATRIASIEFGPGSILAVGEHEGNIHLIDASTGIRGEVIPQPVNAAVDLSFAGVADPFEIGAAALLASAHVNGDINLSSVFADEVSIDGFVDETMRGHKEVTTNVEFGPFGQLASGDFTGEVIWWNAVPSVALGQPLPAAGDVHSFDVVSVAFLDDQTTVSLDLEGVAIAANVADGVGTTVTETSETEFLTALDAGGDRIVAGVNSGDVVIVDNDAETISPSSHGSAIEIVDVSADGSAAVTGSPDDRVVVLWDLASQSERVSIRLPDDHVVSSALHSGAADVWLGVATAEGPAVLRLDAATGDIMTEVVVGEEPADSVSSLAVSNDGTLLAAGVSDRRIRLLDAQTLDETEAGREFEGHREMVTGVTFVEDGETLISADRAGVVMVWDVSSRRAITDLPGPSDGINDLEMNSTQTLLAVAGEDDTVYTWVFDVDVWIERACLLAGRNMTAREWELFGPADVARVRHCPDQPGGEGDPAVYKTAELVD